MVWPQCTASRGTNELVGRRVAFGAVWCRSQNWFSNFPRDLLHVPATRPKWALSSSPTLPPTYRWTVGLRSCHVARSKRTGLLSRHGIWDISASHHTMVYIRLPAQKPMEGVCHASVLLTQRSRARGCCRVPHRSLIRPLTTPTNSHTRSPIQISKKNISPSPPLTLNRHIRVIYATDHISPCTTASEHPFGTTHVK